MEENAGPPGGWRSPRSGGGRMTALIARLWSDERGQDLVEYVLLVVLIAVAAIAAMTTLGTTVNDAYQNAANEVSGAVS